MEILDFCSRKLKALEAEKFELYWERSRSLSIEIKEGKLDHLARATDEGLAIRALKAGRMGFSYTFDLSREAVEKAARTAMEIAELMPADTHNDLGVFENAHYPDVETHDLRGLEQSLEQKIELARAIELAARREDPRIRRVRKAGFEEQSVEVTLMDSGGERLQRHHTVFGIDLLCVAESGAGSNAAEMGYDGQSSPYLDQLAPTEIGATAARRALELLGAGPAPTATCPAVFRNSVVAELIGFLCASFSAENIDKKSSMLEGKRGSREFSDHVTIVDDTLMQGGTATAAFDAEGTPSRTTRLVERGVVANFLYDAYYARKHGAVSTGSSRRGSLKAPPSVGPSNLYLEKGTLGFDALVSAVGVGVLITDVMGLHTANPVTGEFSVGASGRLIEGGRLSRPLKGFAIAGNLPALLRDVTDVGSDLRFWGSIGAPSVAVSRLSIAGS